MAFRKPLLFLLAAILLGFLGWSVPVYWKLMNSQLLEAVGEVGADVVDEANQHFKTDHIGKAQMFLQAADSLDVPDTLGVRKQVYELIETYPEFLVSGGPDPYFDQILRIDPQLRVSTKTALLPNFIPRQTRKSLSAFLENSRSSTVQAVLSTREMTGTRRLMPVYSAAGQPLEATILLTALLIQGNHFSPEVAGQLRSLADQHEELYATQDLERIYFAILSLGQRLNWDQLVGLLAYIESVGQLETVAAYSRNTDEQFSWVYASIILEKSAERVIQYLDTHSKTGIDDLGMALGYGKLAVAYLINTEQAIQVPLKRLALSKHLAWMLDNPGWSRSCAGNPRAALVLKALLILASALCLVKFFIGVYPVVFTKFKKRRKPPRIVAALRTFTLTTVVAFVIVVITEPGVSHDSLEPKPELRLEWAFQDTVESLFTPTERNDTMDQITAITIIIFFLIQVAVYMVCLIKLSEIRRMNVDTETKMELLANEDQLFDTGLYFGLTGTVLSLIFLAIGVVQASLMAAYSSTLFGIIFVAIIKVCHVRPYRKSLILESKKSD